MATSSEGPLEELRQAAASYIPGSIIGPDLFVDADPGEMKKMAVRIGVFGMTGAGKSAFINTLEKIIYRRDYGTAVQQSGGGEGTVLLESYFHEYNFRLVDTRGFMDLEERQQRNEFLRIFYGCHPDGALIVRDIPQNECLQEKPLSKQLHGIIWVIKGNDIRLKERRYAHILGIIREKLNEEAVSIVTVITHDDTFMDYAEREKAETNAQELEVCKKIYSALKTGTARRRDAMTCTSYVL